MQLVNRTIMLNGSEFNLAYYGTGDFGVTEGLSFNLSMRRVKGFWLILITHGWKLEEQDLTPLPILTSHGLEMNIQRL